MDPTLATISVLALLAGDPAPIAHEPPPLEAVDEHVEDADPLAISLRELRIDFRAPAEFERLYRVPGRDDLVMRVNGALHATFPRSVYAATRGGPVPLIPPGTVFHIGAPDDAVLPAAPVAPHRESESAGAARVELRNEEPMRPRGEPDTRVTAVDARIDLAAAAASTVASEIAAAAGARAPAAWQTVGPTGLDMEFTGAPRTIANDAAYRARRVRELILRAAAAGYAARGASSSASK